MAGILLDGRISGKLDGYINRNYGEASWLLVKAYIEQLNVRDSETLNMY